MERFIGIKVYGCFRNGTKFKIQYGEIYRFLPDVYSPCENHLKSSMERFIARQRGIRTVAGLYLKSSMERFIALPIQITQQTLVDLKSSMERFIGG